MKPLSKVSKAVYTDDIDEQNTDYLLKGKSIYAFGDSIVYGHTAPEKSFPRLIAADYEMNLTMNAVNGASIIKSSNWILSQVQNAPSEAPDIVLFDGYTNDAYGSAETDRFNTSGHLDVTQNLGQIQGSSAVEFDNSTFCGGFEELLYTMNQKWENTPIVYVTIHKSGGRNFQIQSQLRELTLQMCKEWGVEVVDIFNGTTLDTRDTEQMKQYIIGGAGSHPNETACKKFYIPFVVNKLKEIFNGSTFPDTIQETVDLAVFAGQSNMSGRGDASKAVVCDVNAGFEYKAISSPDTLIPITEPFGAGEDKQGAIYDYDADGISKRTGSMVSAAADEYYKQTGRQLVAVSASIGGSSSAEWKSKYTEDAAERLERAKTFLAANGIKVGRTFVVWCQGESDGDVKMNGDAYTANTKDIFNVFQSHGAEKCFMVQIGHYNYVDYAGSNNGLTGAEWDEKYGIIRSAQAELCETNEDFVLAGSFEPYIDDMKDRYHYHQTAYNEVGKIVGESIARYYDKELNKE